MSINKHRRRPRGCPPLARRSWGSLFLSYWDDCSSPFATTTTTTTTTTIQPRLTGKDIRSMNGNGDIVRDVAMHLNNNLKTAPFLETSSSSLPSSDEQKSTHCSNSKASPSTADNQSNQQQHLAKKYSSNPIKRQNSRNENQRDNHIVRQQENSSHHNDDDRGVISSTSTLHHRNHRKSIVSTAEMTHQTMIPTTTTNNTTQCSKWDETNELSASRKASAASFTSLRINYLIVTVAIMLADGLQGTHLYVLYEGYGVSVASLYSLGFVTGALTCLVTGPLVDKFGRKRSAILYCLLEIGINLLEQYPLLAGLIASRMVSGVTNNLLSSVFESWLDTEYRRLGFDQDKFEIIMRDSVVLSNLAAIGSGYLSHILAERYGPVGPFQGAVTFTTVALVIVMGVWAENFGSHQNAVKTTVCYLKDAYSTFRSDSRILRVGIIQGLTMGAVQIFVFLWSPALREFAKNSISSSSSQQQQHHPSSIITTMGLDRHGDPAYGLIFGAFMFSGVLGGLVAPWTRKAVTLMLSPLARNRLQAVEVPGVGQVRPMAVEFLAAFCYMICAILLFTPCLLSNDSPQSFCISLGAFLLYEFVVGVYLPCEGVIRSLYIPADARATMMTLPRIIVNIAVALGVVSTNFVSRTSAFAAISCLMLIAAALQISLVSAREWSCLFGRVNLLQVRLVRSFSYLPDIPDHETSRNGVGMIDISLIRSKKEK